MAVSSVRENVKDKDFTIYAWLRNQYDGSNYAVSSREHDKDD